jgi:hypothetical protein
MLSSGGGRYSVDETICLECQQKRRHCTHCTLGGGGLQAGDREGREDCGRCIRGALHCRVDCCNQGILGIMWVTHGDPNSQCESAHGYNTWSVFSCGIFYTTIVQLSGAHNNNIVEHTQGQQARVQPDPTITKSQRTLLSPPLLSPHWLSQLSTAQLNTAQPPTAASQHQYTQHFTALCHRTQDRTTQHHIAQHHQQHSTAQTTQHNLQQTWG